MDIKKEIELRSNYIIRLRKHFHKYPELGMHEYDTSERIKSELENMDIPFIEVGETGVIGIIGKGDKVIALRADMDGLRVQEKNEISYCSVNPGVMHACGHDAHMAALLGAADILKSIEDELNCTIKLIFQPSEENCMGAKIICDEGYMDDVDEIYGLHVFTDMPCGEISIEAGPRMACTDNFKVRLSGKSGHAGKPHQCVDATVMGAATIMNLQTIISREFDPGKSAVVSIGHFESGTQHNIISGEARFEGTVRTFSHEDSKQIKSAIYRIINNTADVYDGHAHIEYRESLHPIVSNDEVLTEKALDKAKEFFDEKAFVTVPKIFLGEDFSTYQQRVPGVFAFVGAGNEALGRAYPNHHNRFNIDEKAVLHATKLYVAFALAGCTE
ncbi:N-acetyl-L,L-diaminopimelate deacetylase [Lachnospiraceae bacterium KM106-2]|nr:N-acetyl-L,L-diaminopimelate deacetylase [Lachnospiraceae bacterium KM106-2]